MLTAKEAYEQAKTAAMESVTWKYLVDRINYYVKHGKVLMYVSFDHNPQTELLALRDLGYTVTPTKIDDKASYYGFTISWF